MAPRGKLAAAMDCMYKNRQKQDEEYLRWKDKVKYYEDWNRKLTANDTWNKKKCDEKIFKEWIEERQDYEDLQDIERRRDKLRMMLFKEEQEDLLEIQCIPKSYHKLRKHHYNINDVPTETLKDINLGLKSAEEKRRKRNAELKLYQQWRSENPIIRDYEYTQNKENLKLSWLDQQITKRMEREKQEEEMRNMIAERDRLIEEDKQLEKLEREDMAKREEELVAQINVQIELLKVKNKEAELCKKQEECVLNKLIHIEDMIRKNSEHILKRTNQEIALCNINQSKLKLKQKALCIEEQLANEKHLLEDIIASKAADEIENQEKRIEIKNYLDYYADNFRKQQDLERKRQKYLETIFDSESQHMWTKMEKVWNDEQAARDRLFQHVLSGLKDQIEDKFKRNIHQQRTLLKDRENLLQVIEDHHQEMKKSMKEIQQRQLERRLGLDEQLNDKAFFNMQEKMQEEKRRRKELEDIRSEEEKLKCELMKMQNNVIPRNKYKRTLLW